MAIYRNARPDHLGALIDLADRVLRKPGHTSMGTASIASAIVRA